MYINSILIILLFSKRILLMHFNILYRILKDQRMYSKTKTLNFVYLKQN